MVLQKALDAPVGEASAIRREGGTRVIDAVRVAADDAAWLLADRGQPDVGVGLDAGWALMEDGIGDPAVRVPGELVRRAGQQSRSDSGADDRGHCQQSQRPARGGGGRAQPRVAPPVIRSTPDPGPARDRAFRGGRLAAGVRVRRSSWLSVPSLRRRPQPASRASLSRSRARDSVAPTFVDVVSRTRAIVA